MHSRTIPAAGAVVWRKRRGPFARGSAPVDVLVVHRPKYDDWSFPKGKLDPGELAPVAAVREVEEETGVRVRLGVPLIRLDYPLSSPRGAHKCVTYWSARPVGGASAEDYVANHEVDEVRWVRSSQVREVLTYDREREVLDAFERARSSSAHRSRTLVVVRHASAVSRRSWRADDQLRPLTARGESQARDLVAVLDAYGVERIVSSEATRCVTTVEPFADKRNTYIVLDQRLNEEATKVRPTGPEPVFGAVDDLLDRKRPTAVCGHRPILPWMFDALGVADPTLTPAQIAVVHHRHGEVFATEIHPS